MARLEAVPQPPAAAVVHPWIPTGPTAVAQRTLGALTEGRITHRRPPGVGVNKPPSSSNPAGGGWVYSYPSTAMMVAPANVMPSAPPSVWGQSPGAPSTLTRPVASAPPIPSMSGHTESSVFQVGDELLAPLRLRHISSCF